MLNRPVFRRCCLYTPHLILGASAHSICNSSSWHVRHAVIYALCKRCNIKRGGKSVGVGYYRQRSDVHEEMGLECPPSAASNV